MFFSTCSGFRKHDGENVTLVIYDVQKDLRGRVKFYVKRLDDAKRGGIYNYTSSEIDEFRSANIWHYLPKTGDR
jgi:hypothetical protein